jgi:alkaline phosphatase D
VVAGVRTADGKGFADARAILRSGVTGRPVAPRPVENTTIGVVATSATLTKVQALKVAQMAHDGFARAISPVHTPGDGDTIFAVATGSAAAPADDKRMGMIGALACGGDGRRDRPGGDAGDQRGRDPRAARPARRALSSGARSMRRRDFIRRALAVPAAYGGLRVLAGARDRPAEAARPAAPYGAAVGDVVPGRAMVWSRADRPRASSVEWDTTDAFATSGASWARRLRRDGLTARVDLTGLPAGQRIAYRVLFQDLADTKVEGQPVTGTFRTPAATSSDVTLAWSADTVGQGWGINPEWGGLKLYETMRRATPDVFIHVGDTIYGDQPLLPEVTLDDGTVWKNVVTPAKSKAAESLDDFRGNHLYNLTDETRAGSTRRSAGRLWDDHEVLDNWYPTEILPREGPALGEARAVLAANAKQAFYEHYPDPPTPRRTSASTAPSLRALGRDLRARHADLSGRELAQPPDRARTRLRDPGRSAARLAQVRPAVPRAPPWKVIASDMPLGLVVTDGSTDFEAVANGEAGGPLGRELEIADVLAFLKKERVRNVVWITGDVHYAAAHHYDPARARFADFDPFWEFVAGPRCMRAPSVPACSIRRSGRRRASWASRPA